MEKIRERMGLWGVWGGVKRERVKKKGIS